MKDTLKIGSMLFRKKGILEHVGIYLGCGRVLHTVPETGVAIVDIDEFGAGQKVRVQNTNEVDQETLTNRLFEILKSDQKYSLTKLNCQHLAHFMLTGIKRSPQLQAAFTSGLLGLIISLNNGKNPILYSGLGALMGCLLYKTFFSPKEELRLT